MKSLNILVFLIYISLGSQAQAAVMDPVKCVQLFDVVAPDGKGYKLQDVESFFELQIEGNKVVFSPKEAVLINGELNAVGDKFTVEEYPLIFDQRALGNRHVCAPKMYFSEGSLRAFMNRALLVEEVKYLVKVLGFQHNSLIHRQCPGMVKTNYRLPCKDSVDFEAITKYLTALGLMPRIVSDYSYSEGAAVNQVDIDFSGHPALSRAEVMEFLPDVLHVNPPLRLGSPGFLEELKALGEELDRKRVVDLELSKMLAGGSGLSESDLKSKRCKFLAKNLATRSPAQSALGRAWLEAGGGAGMGTGPLMETEADDGDSDAQSVLTDRTELALEVHPLSMDIKGKTYTMVDGQTTDFTKRLFSAGGAAGREIILLDPETTPLRETLNGLKITLNGQREATLREKLGVLVNKVRELLPETEGIEKLVESKPMWHLDEFIALKKGVCRHHAFILAYLINNLKGELGLSKKVTAHVARSTLPPNSAHVWVYLDLTEEPVQGFHIDSLWNKIAPMIFTGDDEVDRRFLTTQLESSADAEEMQDYQRIFTKNKQIHRDKLGVEL